jgi:hypothetical protein
VKLNIRSGLCPIGGDANLVLETMALALGRDIFSFQLVDGILETGYLAIGFQAPVSTWVANLQGRTEAQCPRKSRCKTIVANDDNFALAA